MPAETGKLRRGGSVATGEPGIPSTVVPEVLENLPDPVAARRQFARPKEVRWGGAASACRIRGVEGANRRNARRCARSGGPVVDRTVHRHKQAGRGEEVGSRTGEVPGSCPA